MNIRKRIKQRSRWTGWCYALKYGVFDLRLTIGRNGWLRMDIPEAFKRRYGDEVDIAYPAWQHVLCGKRPAVHISQADLGRPTITIRA